MKQKPFNIKTILESLHDEVESGEFTLHDAAKELNKAGWTNFIDEEATRRLLSLAKQCEDKIENS